LEALCAAASSGKMAMQAAAMHPQINALGACAASFANPPSMDACEPIRALRIALTPKLIPEFPTKDHANCGMDELACVATFGVLPKPTIHASID
jgi:hypothetical protein